MYLRARSLTDLCVARHVWSAYVGDGEMGVDGNGVGGVQPVVLPRPP